MNARDVTSKHTLAFATFDDMDPYTPLSVDPRLLELSSASQTQTYTDGVQLQNSSVYISKGTLADGDRLFAEASGVLEGIGSCYNTITTFYVYDKNGNDVTRNYSITCVPGVLELLDPDED